MQSTITISLPEHLKQFLDDQVASGRSASSSDFIRSLLHEEEKKQARERIEALLQEGIDSGPAAPMTPADWDTLRQRVRDRLKSGAKT
jgi:antitoxin ParD1/3/4